MWIMLNLALFTVNAGLAVMNYNNDNPVVAMINSFAAGICFMAAIACALITYLV